MTHKVEIWSDDFWEHQLEAIDWAKEHCPSFHTADAKMNFTDLSDVNHHFECDTVYWFEFDDEQDAVLFSLRWK